VTFGSRDNADQLASRMVKAGEIVRVGRGRYGPVRPRPPRDAAAPPQPANGVNEAGLRDEDNTFAPEASSPRSPGPIRCTAQRINSPCISSPAVTTDGQGREWYTEVSYDEHVRLDPTKITTAQWVAIAERYHRQDGAWLRGWPRPGLPECYRCRNFWRQGR
jgi:hypothetical protein